jgi:nucleoside transporter
MQFFVSGVLSLVLFAYCIFCLPQCPIERKNGSVSLAESLGLNAFRLFRRRRMALFFVFSALLGMCLQVTNGFAGPFITSFKGIPEYADTFAANNATLLTSISQISEALCILMIPFFLKRFGIKVVMLMSMFAWVFRFGFFGIGNPAMPGVIFFILSCIVYGVAFDFFNVSGGIFVDQECEPSIKASAQGLFMMMTNGLGATIGTLAAGEVVNSFCSWQEGYLVGDWQSCWFIFAAFSLVVGISFALVFKPEKR